MPTYEYTCKPCQTVMPVVSTIADFDPDREVFCVHCNQPMGRRFSMSFVPPMPGHFNNALGRYVSGERDFDDGLKRASDEATERNGIPHNYVKVDGRDHEAHGVTGEGLHETQRRRDVQGKKALDLPFST